MPATFGEVLAPAITILGSGVVAYVTARTARGTQRELNAATTEQVIQGARIDAETDAYTRATSYLQSALNDAREELDDTRRELAEERRERREETDMLNAQLTALKEAHARELADLRRRLTAAETRADRAQEAARALARRVGQPDPEA